MGSCPDCQMTLIPYIEGYSGPGRQMKRPQIAIFIFDGADVMDVTGPLSVFEHAGFPIVTFALSDSVVRVGQHLQWNPDYTIDNLPGADVLVFPGGGLAEANPGHSQVTNFIQNRRDKTEVYFSVCSGAFFLGEAGILDNQCVTTFAGLIPSLRENYPEAHVMNDVKYTRNDKIITSSGLSSGIDASFEVVARYRGEGVAQDLANHMEYPWQRQNEYARSQLADNYISAVRNLISFFAIDFYDSKGDHNRWSYSYALTDEISSGDILQILQNELKESTQYALIESDRDLIRGVVQHDVLGPGNFQIELKRNESGPDSLQIDVERQIPYSYQ